MTIEQARKIASKANQGTNKGADYIFNKIANDIADDISDVNWHQSNLTDDDISLIESKGFKTEKILNLYRVHGWGESS